MQACEVTPKWTESFDLSVCSTPNDEFPLELWSKIFQEVEFKKTTSGKAATIRFWLASRTVCKTWHICISKQDFSLWSTSPLDFLGPAEQKMSIPHLLSRFTFSTVRIFHLQSLFSDISLLSKTRQLTVLERTSPLSSEEDIQFLTQLVYLSCPSDFIPNTLTRLTNLRTLHLESPRGTFHPTFKTLSPLTNLEHLKLAYRMLDQSDLAQLPKLETVNCDDPQFFRCGRGESYTGTWTYNGEWKDGKRHGRGECWWEEEFNQDHYSGDWVDDLPHGFGTHRYYNEIHSAYDGSYDEGYWVKGEKHGRGTRRHMNGDEETGEWRQGKKYGSRVYKFRKSGSEVHGEIGAHLVDPITGEDAFIYK